MTSRPRRPATGRRRLLVGLAAVALLPSLAVPAAAEDDEYYAVDACPAEQLADPGFSDLRGTPAPVAVACLAEYGIARGTADGRFDGAGQVTRRQMASFLYRLGTYEGIRWTTADAGFSDLDGLGAEQRTAVAALAGAGIALGKEQGGARVFLPDDPVTRGQMAAFLNRLEARAQSNVDGYAEGLRPRDLTRFDDDAGVFSGDIRAVATAGVARGLADGRFAPDLPVTRVQMARFLARALDLAQFGLTWADGLPRAPFAGVDEAGTVRPRTAQTVAPGGTATYTFAGLDAPGYSLTLVASRGVNRVGGTYLFHPVFSADDPDAEPTVVDPGQVTAVVEAVDGAPPPADGLLRPSGETLSVVLRAGAQDDEVVLPVLHRDGPTAAIDLAVDAAGDLGTADDVVVGGPMVVVAPDAAPGTTAAGTVVGGRSAADVVAVRALDGTVRRYGYKESDVFEVNGVAATLEGFEDEVGWALYEHEFLPGPVDELRTGVTATARTAPGQRATFRLTYDVGTTDLRADVTAGAAARGSGSPGPAPARP